MQVRFSIISAALIALVLAAAPSLARAQEEHGDFVLSSPAFTDGGTIPAQYTCDAKPAGELIPLHWENVPEHAQAFAVTVVDPDAPGGNFVHWIAYNLPAKTRDLPAAAASNPGLSLGAAQGMNSQGKARYAPPCPPTGDHHYIVRVYALDATLTLPSGTTLDKKALDAALQGHVLAQSEITGRYSRQK